VIARAKDQTLQQQAIGIGGLCYVVNPHPESNGSDDCRSEVVESQLFPLIIDLPKFVGFEGGGVEGFEVRDASFDLHVVSNGWRLTASTVFVE
jgi:hypothetical protein